MRVLFNGVTTAAPKVLLVRREWVGFGASEFDLGGGRKGLILNRHVS